MNIKKIIFDIDDTLIPWKKEYNQALIETMKEFNLLYTPEEFDTLIALYESSYPSYNINNFIIHAYNHNIFINHGFVNTWIKKLGSMSTENKDYNNILEYLKQKYELAILTNWFIKCQKERLKNAGMLEYFNEFYGGDDQLKPNPKSFLKACGAYKPGECLMIGDNYKIDIVGAINVGLNVIHVSQSEPIHGLTTVKDITELKRIL